MQPRLETVKSMSPEQYSLIAARRQAFDALLWQTPVLSLTGQAFLFTIALGPDVEAGARVVSSVLALITALASIQLMMKSRALELRDSRLLEAYEEQHNDVAVIHAPPEYGGMRWCVRLSSYRVWLVVLWAFAGAAAIVVGDALCGGMVL